MFGRCAVVHRRFRSDTEPVFVERDFLNVGPRVKLIGNKQVVSMLPGSQQSIEADTEPRWT